MELRQVEAGTLLTEALESFSKVFVLTHIPPWDTATWHDHKHSDPDWMPWFSCKAVGEVIEECAKAHKGKKITVLCGHTHGKGKTQISNDIKALTGGAVYRSPEVAQIFEI